jgi:hypothetical protein
MPVRFNAWQARRPGTTARGHARTAEGPAPTCAVGMTGVEDGPIRRAIEKRTAPMIGLMRPSQAPGSFLCNGIPFEGR